jgi:hypothetical protein
MHFLKETFYSLYNFRIFASYSYQNWPEDVWQSEHFARGIVTG